MNLSTAHVLLHALPVAARSASANAASSAAQAPDRAVTSGSPAPAATEIVDGPGLLDDERVQRVVNGWLDPAREARLQGGVEWGVLAAAGGVSASLLGQFAGIPGIVAATAMGLAGGVAVGLRSAHRGEGEDRIFPAFLGAALGGFGALIPAALAHGYGVAPALLAAGGVALLAPVVGFALGKGRARQAQREFERLDRDLDRAMEMDRMVLKNREAEARQANGGSVRVEEEQVIVGGIKIPKGKRPA